MDHSFGERLRAIRKDKNLSQQQLALMAGLHSTYISKIESGLMRPPAARTILRLCNILKTDPEEFFLLAHKVPADFNQAMSSNPAVLEFVRRAQSMELTENEWQTMTEELAHLREHHI